MKFLTMHMKTNKKELTFTYIYIKEEKFGHSAKFIVVEEENLTMFQWVHKDKKILIIKLGIRLFNCLERIGVDTHIKSLFMLKRNTIIMTTRPYLKK